MSAEDVADGVPSGALSSLSRSRDRPSSSSGDRSDGVDLASVRMAGDRSIGDEGDTGLMYALLGRRDDESSVSTLGETGASLTVLLRRSGGSVGRGERRGNGASCASGLA